MIVELGKQGFQVRHLNHRERALRLNFVGRIARAFSIPSLVSQIFFYGIFRGYSLVYVPMAGGYGQLLDLFIAVTARVAGCRLVLHHHSFAYLNHYKLLTAAVVRVAGIRAVHIVLGPTMETKLKSQYGSAHTFFASNAKFVTGQLSTTENLSSLRIGFLGNLSESKGILEFLAVCSKLSKEGISFEATIAGPWAHERIRRKIHAAQTSFGNLRYIGPVYGNDKLAFFREVDVLIFPSKYENEAEPLVILEALSCGIPCIATRVGEIDRLLSYGSLDSTFELPEFVEGCVALLKTLMDSSVRTKQRSQAKARFEELREEAHKRFSELFILLATTVPRQS
jgi:glycosyltransferase involved in cell wall biosynthesis